jgi:hypothetical protein
MDSLPPRDNAKLRSWNNSRDGRKNRKVLSNLREAIQDPLYMLPTPATRDHKGGANWENRKRNGKQRPEADKTLPDVVEKMLPTPSASMMTMEDMEQARYSGNGGKRPKYKDAVTHGTNRGLKLQPGFVEYMMGFPVGWTELTG